MTDPNCQECEGEGIVHESDRSSSDGIREVACECNGPDEDAEYEAYKDMQIDMEESKRDAYD